MHAKVSIKEEENSFFLIDFHLNFANQREKYHLSNSFDNKNSV